MFDPPSISRHLLRDDGEVVVDVVDHHWAAYTRAILELLVAIGMLVLTAIVPMMIAWLPLLLCFGLLVHAGWLALAQRRDRFVITNMRVFRINGVLSTRISTMPLSRILDITVVTPFEGRILGYGHFTFESAADDQGLRDIRYVSRPVDRDLVIQRVVQRSGLRPGTR